MFDFFEEKKPVQPEGVEIEGDFQCQSPGCIDEKGFQKSVEIAYWNPQTNVLTWVCPAEHKSSIKDFM